MHLRKGLENVVEKPLRRKGVPVSDASPYPADPPAVDCVAFGVALAVQEALAHVRTDLDSFSEIEAHSLMLDGYKLTAFEVEHADGIGALQQNALAPGASRWAFGRLRDAIGDPERSPYYLRSLEAARLKFLKPLALRVGVRWAPYVAVLAVLTAGTALVAWQWEALSDALRAEWPARRVALAIGVPLLVVGAYFGTMAKSRSCACRPT